MLLRAAPAELSGNLLTPRLQAASRTARGLEVKHPAGASSFLPAVRSPAPPADRLGVVPAGGEKTPKDPNPFQLGGKRVNLELRPSVLTNLGDIILAGPPAVTAVTAAWWPPQPRRLTARPWPTSLATGVALI